MEPWYKKAQSAGGEDVEGKRKEVSDDEQSRPEDSKHALMNPTITQSEAAVRTAQVIPMMMRTTVIDARPPTRHMRRPSFSMANQLNGRDSKTGQPSIVRSKAARRASDAPDEVAKYLDGEGHLS